MCQFSMVDWAGMVNSQLLTLSQMLLLSQHQSTLLNSQFLRYISKFNKPVLILKLTINKHFSFFLSFFLVKHWWHQINCNFRHVFLLGSFEFWVGTLAMKLNSCLALRMVTLLSYQRLGRLPQPTSLWSQTHSKLVNLARLCLPLITKPPRRRSSSIDRRPNPFLNELQGSVPSWSFATSNHLEDMDGMQGVLDLNAWTPGWSLVFV